MSNNPLAALAMRERAASEMDIAAHVMSHYGSDIEQRTYQYARKQIRSLPTTFTDAELLDAAMQLPEVRALVDAADAMKTQLVRAAYESVNMYTGKTERHFGVFGETWLWFCAALAPFTKGGE